MSTRKFSTRVDSMPALPVIEGVEIRHCPGCDGYAVGDDGSVWSCRHPHGYLSEWRQLKPHATNKYGHLSVSIWRDGKKVMRSVHRFVLEAFVGPCPDGMECRHFPDRDPGNNRRSNLQWGTHAENMHDMVIHGTANPPDNRGERCGNSVLTNEQAAAIYNESDNASTQELADKYGVSRPTISGIRSQEAWKVLGLPPKPPKYCGSPGERNPASKLTEHDVREIRKRFADGERQAKLARDFSVTATQIHYIVTRKQWRHIQD